MDTYDDDDSPVPGSDEVVANNDQIVEDLWAKKHSYSPKIVPIRQRTMAFAFVGSATAFFVAYYVMTHTGSALHRQAVLMWLASRPPMVVPVFTTHLIFLATWLILRIIYRKEIGWFILFLFAVTGALTLVIFGVGEPPGQAEYKENTVVVTEDVAPVAMVLSRAGRAQSLSVSPGCDISVENYGLREWCLRSGSLPTEGWAMSYGSEETAQSIFLIQSDRLDALPIQETVTHLTGAQYESSWTAISSITGSNDSIVQGVSDWSGRSRPTSCLFSEDHQQSVDSLHEAVAAQYPALITDTSDWWGYCEDGAPVIIMPASKWSTASHSMWRSILHLSEPVRQSGGIMIYKETAKEEPEIVHVPKVDDGTQYDGPVYPESLAIDQISMVTGRDHVGKPYLLRSMGENPELQFVLPLTFALGESLSHDDADSDPTITGYAIVRADQTKQGKVGDLTIYLVPSTAQSAIGSSEIQSLIEQQISRIEPDFLNDSTDLIVGLSPITPTSWQAYGLVQGQPTYRFVVSFPSKYPQVDVYELNPLTGDDISCLTCQPE